MSHLIVGLGNPGSEYRKTRHNAGRWIVEAWRQARRFPDWQLSKKAKALISKGKLGRQAVYLILPETMMNNSGRGIAPFVQSPKQAKQLIVVHDELDLPLGRFKLSFNRGAAGHRGVESVIRQLKTKEFIRLRIGTCPATPQGKLKKPPTPKQIIDFLLGQWSKKEEVVLKKITKQAIAALDTLITKF